MGTPVLVQDYQKRCRRTVQNRTPPIAGPPFGHSLAGLLPVNWDTLRCQKRELSSTPRRNRMNYGRIPTVRKFLLFAALPLLSLVFSVSARAQYTDRQAIDDLGGPKAFAARRAELAKQVKTGWVLLFARNEIPESTHYREDKDFYYFTGLQDPGAVMALDAEK